MLRLQEQVKRAEHAFQRIGSWQTWTCVVNMDGFLEGTFEDWPSHIQDALLKRVEQQCIPKPGQHVKIVAARCYSDAPDEWPYLLVVVQAFPNITVH